MHVDGKDLTAPNERMQHFFSGLVFANQDMRSLGAERSSNAHVVVHIVAGSKRPRTRKRSIKSVGLGPL